MAEPTEDREHKAAGGMVTKNTGEDTEHDWNKKGGTVRRPRRAKGGSTKVNQYNAEGSPEADEAKDASEDFKRGGDAKRKAGGMVHGEGAKARGDRMPRGREHHAAGGRAGGSVWSSGRELKSPKDDKAGRGHEDVAVPSEPG